jgi:protein-S-isoprenylcysteine O-methyltransferase Ste14
MHQERVKLDRYGKKELIGHLAGPVLISAIFFVTAGTLNMYRAWIWAGAMTLFYAGGLLVLLRANPELLNARGGWNKNKDTKSWDRLLLLVFGGVGLYAHTVIMALDAGRFGWSSMSPWWILPGMWLYIACFNLVYWSMAVNKHFEPSVRIQHDRNHRVVTWGPYQIVRHPGYLGLIMGNFGSAMIIGSLYGLITAAATLMLLVYRTYLEDRTLMSELEGYRDYALKTRYRLIPFLW